jgi:cellulose synthase/poly-beta-1,6-N-acetylglucosamine synthase-like glycosyltransferase
MPIIFWSSVGILVYVLLGYPLLLRLIVLIRGPRVIQRGPALPRVTLIISAYNEALTIREKLTNSLSLDYPGDLLQIIVVSDASDDGTDEIVREFASQGVGLRRQAERRGKTAGLNAVIPVASGEVLVFSDANAMYQHDALRMLVRNFADPQVGCVTGEARYVVGGATPSEAGEMAYWNYEMAIKRLETAVGSMVGGDGAIYAIRAGLWRALPEDAINDFLNPLQIVAAGWRAVYEPDAICYEETAGTTGREYRRRVRIVSRSWRAVFQAPAALNPFRVGLFSLSLVSHKILRWLSGIFLVLALAAPLGMNDQIEAGHARMMIVATAIVAALMLTVPAIRRLASYALYFLVITVASLVGIAKGSVGRVSGTWTPPRAAAEAPAGPAHQLGLFSAGRFIIGALSLVTLILIVSGLWRGTSIALATLFWGSFAALAYVYAGYPLLLLILRTFWRRPARQEPQEPRICLLITANDEESVMDAKLRNSMQLNYPRELLRVVVASDGSIDRTNDIVRSYAPEGVVLRDFPERRGKMAAINEAISDVLDDIVVFSDANTFLQPGALRALVRNFTDPQVGAVSGDVVLVGERAALAQSEDLYYRYERWIQQAESEIGSMVGVDGALYAIRRELFVPPPLDTILDDMAIPMAVIRAGRRVVFEPGALAIERGSDTAVEEFARKSRVVAGAVQFLGRTDSAVPVRNLQVVLALTSHKALRWLSPAFAIAAFVASVALAFGSTFFGVLAAAQALSLGLALAGCFRRARRWNPIGFTHYFWLVQAAAAVGFVRGLLGRQSVAWRRFQRPSMEVT